MKKLCAGLLFAVLVATGLVGAVGTAAVADPYPGTVKTEIHARFDSRVVRQHRLTVRVNVTASGNAQPKGRVKCTVKRIEGGFSYSISRAYSGGTIKFHTPKLDKRGRYSVTCRFVPKSGSVFKPSSTSGGFRVVRH